MSWSTFLDLISTGEKRITRKNINGHLWNPDLHPAHTYSFPYGHHFSTQGIRCSAIPGLHSINHLIWSWTSTPSLAVRLPKSAGPICHIQKPYTSVHGPNTGSPPAASCSHYLEILFFQGLGSFVCSSIFGSFYHAATNYVVKTSKVKQRDHTEKAHGDHLQDKDRPVSSANSNIQQLVSTDFRLCL